MKNKIKLMIVATLCILVMACGGSGKSGKVVYESADKKIKVYESEVNYEVNKNLEAAGVAESEVPAEQMEQMKINIIQNIALTRAIALEGKSQKLEKNKKYTDGIENAKESLLAAVTVAERSKDVEVSEARLKEIYEANKANFERREDTVRLQLVVVGTEAKDKAEAALKEALAAPDKFTDVVKKYTAVPDSANGETAEIPVSQLAKDYNAINEAVKSVNPGQIVNNVITVGNELYVVKVLEKNAKGFVEFEKVKKDLKNQVVAQEKQQKSQSFIQEMTNKYGLDKISKDTVNLTKK